MESYLQRSYHYNISKFLSRNFIGQERVKWHIQLIKRQKLPKKNSLFCNVIIQIWRKNKGIWDKWKSWELTMKSLLARNAKRSPSNWNRKMIVQKTLIKMTSRNCNYFRRMCETIITWNLNENNIKTMANTTW